MPGADDQIVYTDCRPYLSMGTLWKCNQVKSDNCIYALNFGDVFYCTNKRLQKNRDDEMLFRRGSNAGS